MALPKSTSSHVEDAALNPSHEAALTGAVALANLFSNCVEAFGLIHPKTRWEHDEQLLLARLGIQQARLLIWGHIVGVSSPPSTVTDRAVPKYPSSAYPDLSEPTFFGARDPRLDDPSTRTTIENALSAIVDRSSSSTREEMMNKYGLKPPKKFLHDYMPALDTNRLEAFRERHELLLEVAEAYARISARRANSIVQTQWVIADNARFAALIRLTQEKVDQLIGLMGVREGVDRGMRMDIRALGWHLTVDRARTAFDTSKLRLIGEVCREEYPEYVDATQAALANIEREARESGVTYAAWKRQMEGGNGGHEKGKKSVGLFGGLLKGFRKGNSHAGGKVGVSHEAPGRSHSDSGPSAREMPLEGEEDGGSIEPIRSKSVGAILDGDDVASIEEQLAKMRTHDSGIQQRRSEEVAAAAKELEDWRAEAVVGSVGTNESMISRHDQYHGIARTATRDLKQGYQG